MIRDSRYKLIELERLGRFEFYDLAERQSEGADLIGALRPGERAAFERLRDELAETVAKLDGDRRAHLPDRAP